MSKPAYYFRCAVWAIVGLLFIALALGALAASVQTFSRRVLHALAVDSTLRAPSTLHSKLAHRSQLARGVEIFAGQTPQIQPCRPVPTEVIGASFFSGESVQPRLLGCAPGLQENFQRA